MDKIKAHRVMNFDCGNWDSQVANTLYNFGVGLGLDERTMNESYSECNWNSAEAKALYALAVASGMDERELNEEYHPTRDGVLNGALRSILTQYLIKHR